MSADIRDRQHRLSSMGSLSDVHTRAVHAGRESLRQAGFHASPIDLSTTYPLGDLEEAGQALEALALGAPTANQAIYARLHNPTVARFEEALADLEGSEEAVAFSSGMAALTAVLMAATTMPEKGRHIVALRPLYGGSDHLLTSELLGLDVSWVEPEGITAALRPDTALVLVETPANPTLRMVDIEAVVAAARGVPVLVDSTFATPILQNPLAHGAKLVLHSATKALGGHGDVVGGAVACDAGWAAALRRVRVATGALLHPLAGYLLHRGLQTLALRVERAQANADFLARRLVEHPLVNEVHYPGFRKTDPLGLLPSQMRGPGTMLAIEIDPSRAHIQTLFDHLEIITPAVSLGSVDTLIQHPASLTHRPVSLEAKESAGIKEGLLRLSVGIEDAEDLWRDLKGALDTLR